LFELGLSLALVSAIAVNWAYAKEHDAAATLPPLTLRAPWQSVRLLLGARAWLTAFGVETVGFLLYVAALQLAPLSLVQAVCATGIAVLAFVSCGGRVSRLSRREQTAVVLAFVGLLLLSLSLTGDHQADTAPSVVGVLIWLPACAAAAVLAVRVLPAGVPAARYGLAAGLLFAAGDISAKLVGYGGGWLSAILPIIVCYGFGTSVLQAAFQRGAALTAAGIATLTTNAVPIAAGFVLFNEVLPSGAAGALQIAAFCLVVISGALLGRRNPAGSGEVVEPWQSRQKTASAQSSRAPAKN
jgi:drug/metabolite transporter (DMT)-like permease